VTVPEDVQRRVRKSGNPPRTDYRVLKLTLPATAKARGDAPGGDGDKPGVRFHLVRGHFKNLTHERYRHPGLHWWPSHTRGQESLVVVRLKTIIHLNADEAVEFMADAVAAGWSVVS